MRILLVDPFHGGSHAAVAAGYAQHSRHEITLLTLSPAGGWRWRMRGAAVTLARRLRELDTGAPFDALLTTDMLDLATFLGLTRDLTAGLPTAVYFHENQLTYPLPAGRGRDLAFPWINYTTALAADRVLFNSNFHHQTLLAALPELLGRYHDHQERDLVAHVAARSQVLPPGVDLARLDLAEPAPPTEHAPVILWNSRWEYDKQPEVFFAALDTLAADGFDFRVIVAGKHVNPAEPAFQAARERLGERVLAWGYAADDQSYAVRLRQADLVVSTAIQEFFGIGVIEALYCGCVPLLPRRLSYPEILPPATHAACLYDDPADLVVKLAAALRDLPQLRRYDFRAVAAAYDWAQLAPQWDAMLEQLAGG